MAKSDMIEVEGVVVESLPNTTFQVDIGKSGILRERGYEARASARTGEKGANG